MELLARAIILRRLTLLLICSLNVCLAEDCGGDNVASTIVVDQSGQTPFKMVQAAIDSIPINNNKWVKVHINAGTYREQVHIPYEKPCVFLEGQGREVTIITYDAHERTDTSATFCSAPNNVVAKGITFMNSFNVAPSLNGQPKIRGNRVVQAVAASIYGDKSAFYDCSFIGYQDTLWDVQGRHYFKNCIIEGATDFIFGRGQSYYEDCTLKVISSGFITAQGRNSCNDPSGFVFHRGSVFGSGNSLLGRAYGPFSRVIFHGTNLGSVVHPPGWDAWKYGKQEANFTYAEVDCVGAGAARYHPKNRVPWVKELDDSQMKQFSRSSFIDQDGWIAKLPVK